MDVQEYDGADRITLWCPAAGGQADGDREASHRLAAGVRPDVAAVHAPFQVEVYDFGEATPQEWNGVLQTEWGRAGTLPSSAERVARAPIQRAAIHRDRRRARAPQGAVFVASRADQRAAQAGKACILVSGKRQQ